MEDDTEELLYTPNEVALVGRTTTCYTSLKNLVGILSRLDERTKLDDKIINKAEKLQELLVNREGLVDAKAQHRALLLYSGDWSEDDDTDIDDVDEDY